MKRTKPSIMFAIINGAGDYLKKNSYPTYDICRARLYRLLSHAKAQIAVYEGQQKRHPRGTLEDLSITEVEVSPYE